jgi:hypothetical protein
MTWQVYFIEGPGGRVQSATLVRGQSEQRAAQNHIRQHAASQRQIPHLATEAFVFQKRACDERHCMLAPCGCSGLT